MKNLYLLSISTVPVLLCLLTLCWAVSSCESYLEVSPKSQILTEEHFSTERGYFDHLTGVYTKMASTNLYGREMSFGFAEVLSQNYDMGGTNTYRFAQQYDYENTSTKTRIDQIWSGTYNCIANLNLILEEFESADPTMFTDNHYDIYKGEALGLRAFLHFELMKGFSPSPASNENAMAVPYVTRYAPKVTEQKTVEETMDLIIGDLQASLEFLKSDSLNTSARRLVNHFSSRSYYFNYFAAKQTLARAYLWKGDMEMAAATAEEVIAEYESSNNPFRFVHYSELQGVPNESIRRMFPSEHVFRLNVVNFEDIVDPFFTEEAGANSFTFSDEKLDEFFEKTTKGLGNDFRSLFGFQYDGSKQYLWKYHQYGISDDLVPLIRMPEIYYIAAEALKKTNPARSIELLNTVRQNRNIDEANNLPSTLSPEEIQQEIFQEYRKEFLGEGQLFFYYKRLNLPTIEGSGTSINDAVYVWPMPDNEIEFGNR